MTKQTIKYNSNNKYFAGFLQSIIDESNINASVSQNENEIILLVDENDPNITTFNENITKRLPHSIFIGEIETSTSDEKIQKSNFKSESYNIAPCAKCLYMLNDPSSSYYLDESLKCDHYSNEIDKIYDDNTIFSPHYSKGCAVLITDASKINDLFIVTKDELKALFSIEKPTIKDETLKELTGKNHINIKAPYNNRSALVAINAKESNVDYLFFEDNNDLKAVIVKQNTTIIRANRVTTPLKELDTDKQINRFLNIANEANFAKSAIGVNLSRNDISFIVSNEIGAKKVIQFQEFKLADLFYGIYNDTIKNKLLFNFYAKYPHIEDKLSSVTEINLFELICLILDIEKENSAFEALSNKSFEFRGNGGLKIDTHYNSEGFDYVSFIGSIISFRLAGAEIHYIAYSIFEAFGDMAISTLNQLKERFKIDNIIMMGDIFENSILYSRILSKYQLSNPYFAKSIALDE